MQFSGCATKVHTRYSGGNGEGEPPVPIPNTEVKPFSADGTWLETARESRTLPDPTKKNRFIRVGSFFILSKFPERKQRRAGGAFLFYDNLSKGSRVIDKPSYQ